MQSTWTVWTTLIGNHLGIIPVKFGQIPISGSEEMLFKEIVDARTMDNGQWAITKAHHEHYVLRWAKKSYIFEASKPILWYLFYETGK